MTAIDLISRIFLSQYNRNELAMKVVRETEKEIRLYEQIKIITAMVFI